jgi:3',5'-cyclic AMP phosphodiesterase CpdA
VFVLAHLSDLHATAVRIRSVREILNKRALGWLSWTLRRSKEHRAHVLEALAEDLLTVAPDHVAVTGDLTNLGLDQEFEEAASWLRQLGDPTRVSIVPGNHDAYVSSPGAPPWALWAEFMASESLSPGALASKIEFPSLRIRGSVALIGLSSARPTPLFLASGHVGTRQRERLGDILTELGEKGLCRVVLIHHPPKNAWISRRRCLTDAAELCATLEAVGAELVLHGHTHRNTRETLLGPDGVISVLGVPSASSVGHKPERRAQYHVYRIEPGPTPAGRRFHVSCAVRGFDPESGRFESQGEWSL